MPSDTSPPRLQSSPGQGTATHPAAGAQRHAMPRACTRQRQNPIFSMVWGFLHAGWAHPRTICPQFWKTETRRVPGRILHAQALFPEWIVLVPRIANKHGQSLQGFPGSHQIPAIELLDRPIMPPCRNMMSVSGHQAIYVSDEALTCMPMRPTGEIAVGNGTGRPHAVRSPANGSPLRSNRR